MFSKLEFNIAFRYLRARRREGFISVVAWFSLIGVMLGVATLIVVLSVMNGFRADLLSRIIGINGQVMVYEMTGGALKNYDTLSTTLKGMDKVISATPIIEAQALASTKDNSSGVMIRAMDIADFMQRPLYVEALDGNIALENFKQDNKVVLGSRLARRLSLRQGDKVKLLSPNMKNTLFGALPSALTVQSAGNFHFNMYEYDDSFLFMDLTSAQEFLGMEGVVSRIEVMGHNPEKAHELAQEIRHALPFGHRVVPWQELSGSFVTALQVERNVMFLILTLIILVAAFNIVSSQIMLVKEKARGIAIMRGMGATKASIMRVFLISGSTVGILGAGLGAALGLVIANNIEAVRHVVEALLGVDVFAAEIYFLSTLPSKIDYDEVGFVIGIAVTLSLAASIYPAWRASRMDPVEILRYG